MSGGQQNLWDCPFRAAKHDGADSEDAERLADLIEEDIALLSEFGAEAFGFAPGIQADLGQRATLSLDTPGWNWLRPLLLELRAHRKVGPLNQRLALALVATGELKVTLEAVSKSIAVPPETPTDRQYGPEDAVLHEEDSDDA